MKKKLLLILSAAMMVVFCCACANTLEGFAGSYFTEADGWTADEKANTFVKEFDEEGITGTDSVHFAGNYVTYIHTETFADDAQKEEVLSKIAYLAGSEETYTDKAAAAKAFVELSDAAGITNGTADYTLVIDENAVEHFTMTYEEAMNSLGE